jgi:hypothetical protein
MCQPSANRSHLHVHQVFDAFFREVSWFVLGPSRGHHQQDGRQSKVATPQGLTNLRFGRCRRGAVHITDRFETNDHCSSSPKCGFRHVDAGKIELPAVIRTATCSPLRFFGEGGTTPRRSQRQNKYAERKIERDPRLALARVPTPILPQVVGRGCGEKSLRAL